MANRFTVTLTIENNLGTDMTLQGNPNLSSGTIEAGSAFPRNVAAGSKSMDVVITTNNASRGVQGNATYLANLNGRDGYITLIFKSNNSGTHQVIVSDNPYIATEANAINTGNTPLKVKFVIGS